VEGLGCCSATLVLPLLWFVGSGRTWLNSESGLPLVRVCCNQAEQQTENRKQCPHVRADNSLEFWLSRGTQEHFVLPAGLSAFFSVFMTSDKFVFQLGNFAAVYGFSILIKVELTDC